MRYIRRYRRMRDALLNIGTDCTSFTRGSCREPWSGRRANGQYLCERWCDNCIAWDGLNG